MKIALLNTLPSNTGAGKYAFELFSRLKKFRKDINMIYLNYKTKNFDDKRIITKKPIKLPFLRQTLNEQLFFPKKIPKDYDLYHLTGQGMSIFAKYTKKPIIITVHDIIPFIFKKGIISCLSRRSIKYCRLADVIIADSHHTKKDLTKYLKIDPDKIKVVYLGVDHKIFKPLKLKKDNSKIILLHVGSEEPRKNVDLIIKAFYKLKKDFKKLRLIRVGKPTKRIAKLINELNLNHYIKYISNVEEKQLPKIYNSADVFIFPSSYEGFGLPPLEAMACGCPVVSSNKTSLPEILGDAALLIEPNEQELSKAISRILKNKKLKNKLIRKGLKQSKKFTWEKCAKSILKIYKSVMSNRKIKI